jgi:hypothetical protein
MTRFIQLREKLLMDVLPTVIVFTLMVGMLAGTMFISILPYMP